MAVPKKQKTQSARNQRRSHHALKKQILSVCDNCGEPRESHKVCPNCGYYKGKKVVEVVQIEKQLEKKRKKKEAMEKAKEEAREEKKK